MAARTATRTGSTPWPQVIALIACVTVFDVTFSISYPLLSLILEGRGTDAATIGSSAAMTPLGMVAAAPLVPRLASRFGAWSVAFGCIVATGVAFPLLRVFDTLEAWFVLRFVLGCAVGALFSLSEAWINTLANHANRGRITGLYSSVLAAGFAIGPFILPLTGTAGWAPFLVGAGFAAAALVPLMQVRQSAPSIGRGPPVRIASVFRAAPVLLLCVFAASLFDTATMALLPVYMLRSGFGDSVAAIALGILIVGNVALQPVLGWIADRTSIRAVLTSCIVFTGIGGALLPFLVATPWLWALLPVWGAAAYGVYTLSLADLGSRFSTGALVAGAAAFTVVWGIGGILGPIVGGLAMEMVGPMGLPFCLCVVFVLLLLAHLGSRAGSGQRDLR